MLSNEPDELAQVSELTVGQRRAQTILARDPDHYRKMGRKGHVGKGGGFYTNRELAKRAGRLGAKANLAKYGKEAMVERINKKETTNE